MTSKIHFSRVYKDHLQKCFTGCGNYLDLSRCSTDKSSITCKGCLNFVHHYGLIKK